MAQLQPDFGPDFSKGLVPAIAQDAATGEVLMLAYMNEEAWKRTLETGEAHYWSRSRKELWHKGGTSGNVQKVLSIRLDCDSDTVLLKIEQIGGAACHTGRRSCFYREWDNGRGARVLPRGLRSQGRSTAPSSRDRTMLSSGLRAVSGKEPCGAWPKQHSSRPFACRSRHDERRIAGHPQTGRAQGLAGRRHHQPFRARRLEDPQAYAQLFPGHQ